MPTYNFRHKETGEEQEVLMKISELDEWKENNPEWIQFLTGAPKITRGTTKGNYDTGFKEVLQKIDERVPGGMKNSGSSQL